MEDVVDYAVGFVNDKLTPKEFCARLGFCGGDDTPPRVFSESTSFHCFLRPAFASPCYPDRTRPLLNSTLLYVPRQRASSCKTPPTNSPCHACFTFSLSRSDAPAS